MNSKFFQSVFYSANGLRLGWTILFFVLIIVVTVAVIVAPVVFLLSLIDLPPQPGQPVTGWSSIVGSIITLSTGYAAFLIGTHIAQRLLRKGDLQQLGLQTKKGWCRDLTTGVSLGTIIVLVAVFLSWLSGYYRFTGFAWQFRPASILLPAITLSFIANLQSPIIEEVIFRGFLLQTFVDRWGMRTSVLLTSLLFGLAHLLNVDAEYPAWAAVISTFLAGLMFTQAYRTRNNLWLPLGIHFGWILTGRLLNDVGGPAENALFIVSRVECPPLIGTPSGGGAGLFELIGVGLVSLILWKTTKRHQN